MNDSSTAPEKKTSHFKRLRLRGDWSDTGRFYYFIRIFFIVSLHFKGPGSRPMHEKESQSSTTINNSNSVEQEQQQQQSLHNDSSDQQSTPRHRNLQNIFMERMSDILTQLVSPTETENEERQSRATQNNNEDNNNNNLTPTVTEVDTDAELTSTTATSPIVQSPPSPTSNEASESAATNNNDDDSTSENSRDVSVFNLKMSVLVTSFSFKEIWIF